MTLDGAPVTSRPIGLTRRVVRAVRRGLRVGRLYLLKAEVRFAPTEAQRVFLLTMAIGAACGLAAVAFHLAIRFAEARLIERALSGEGHTWVTWTIVTPVLGGFLCGALLEFVFPRARGSGIPQVKQAFAAARPDVPLRDSIGKFLVGSLQIGSGASLGREGPTVQICAGVASWFGRSVSVAPKTQRRLIPVGVAAGIAAAFNAPIAAVTFTIEEVVGSLDQAVLSGVIVAAAIAAVIERSLLGENPVFDVPEMHGLRHPSSLIVYAGIGLAAAAASIVFTESLLAVRARMRRLEKVPAWTRPALGGAVTGLLAVAARMWLDTDGVTGGGYATLGAALNARLVWWVLLGLGALKLVATVASYSSGGAGGIFAPTLFIGGMIGGAVGALDTAWLGHVDQSAGAFALVGMGAMFAGVIRAPMTSVLIIVEMTRGYSLILPLMIANTTAYVLARRFRAESVYEALLEQDGVRIPHASRPGEVRRVVTLAGEPRVMLEPSMSAEEVLLRCGGENGARVYPVVDAERHLIGIVAAEELGIVASKSELLPLTTASDLMRAPVSVRHDDPLTTVIERMITSGLHELPVVDDGDRVIGRIDDRVLATAYHPAGAH